MTSTAQFAPAVDYRMGIRRQYQFNINGIWDMDQLEMATIADDADDDQRSLNTADAIPQPSFTVLAGLPRLSA